MFHFFHFQDLIFGWTCRFVPKLISFPCGAEFFCIIQHTRGDLTSSTLKLWYFVWVCACLLGGYERHQDRCNWDLICMRGNFVSYRSAISADNEFY